MPLKPCVLKDKRLVFASSLSSVRPFISLAPEEDGVASTEALPPDNPLAIFKLDILILNDISYRPILI